MISHHVISYHIISYHIILFHFNYGDLQSTLQGPMLSTLPLSLPLSLPFCIKCVICRIIDGDISMFVMFSYPALYRQNPRPIGSGTYTRKNTFECM